MRTFGQRLAAINLVISGALTNDGVNCLLACTADNVYTNKYWLRRSLAELNRPFVEMGDSFLLPDNGSVILVGPYHIKPQPPLEPEPEIIYDEWTKFEREDHKKLRRFMGMDDGGYGDTRTGRCDWKSQADGRNGAAE